MIGTTITPQRQFVGDHNRFDLAGETSVTADGHAFGGRLRGLPLDSTAFGMSTATTRVKIIYRRFAINAAIFAVHARVTMTGSMFTFVRHSLSHSA